MFGKKTVDSVMSGFSKIIKDLDEVASTNAAEVAEQDDVIEAAMDRRVAALAEVERVAVVRTKLVALVG